MVSITLKNDIITSMNVGQHLTISTFNKKIILLNDNLEIKKTFDHNHPVLYSYPILKGLVFTDVLGNFSHTDINTETNNCIPTKCSGIEKINSISSKEFIFGGYNKSICITDLDSIQLEHKVPHKIYHSELNDNNFFCTSDKEVFMYDIRQLSNGPIYRFDNKVRIDSFLLKNDNKFILGSLNGKIRFESTKGDLKESLCFLGHKKEDKENINYYPVSDLKIANGFLYSSGLDGNIYQWNMCDRKKTKHVYSSDYGITKFVTNGDLLFFGQLKRDSAENKDDLLSDTILKRIYLN